MDQKDRQFVIGSVAVVPCLPTQRDSDMELLDRAWKRTDAGVSWRWHAGGLDGIDARIVLACDPALVPIQPGWLAMGVGALLGGDVRSCQLSRGASMWILAFRSNLEEAAVRGWDGTARHLSTLLQPCVEWPNAPRVAVASPVVGCCEYEHVHTNRWICKRCGRVIHVSDHAVPPQMECEGEWARNRPAYYVPSSYVRSDWEMPSVRHLVFHMYPFELVYPECWRRHAAMISEAWPMFNGRKLIGIALDDSCATEAEVRAAFPRDAEFLVVRNNPGMREGATSKPLLRELKRVVDKRHAVFFAHSKGVRYRPESIVHVWWQVMYYHCLRRPEAMELLAERTFSGAILFSDGIFESTEYYPWHFAGSYYWFHAESVLQHPRFDQWPDIWYMAEAFPALFGPIELAGGTLYTGRLMHCYDIAVWRDVLLPLHESYGGEKMDVDGLLAGPVFPAARFQDKGG